jgi:hypothetical protein
MQFRGKNQQAPPTTGWSRKASSPSAAAFEKFRRRTGALRPPLSSARLNILERRRCDPWIILKNPRHDPRHHAKQIYMLICTPCIIIKTAWRLPSRRAVSFNNSRRRFYRKKLSGQCWSAWSRIQKWQSTFGPNCKISSREETEMAIVCRIWIFERAPPPPNRIQEREGREDKKNAAAKRMFERWEQSSEGKQFLCGDVQCREPPN